MNKIERWLDSKLDYENELSCEYNYKHVSLYFDKKSKEIEQIDNNIHVKINPDTKRYHANYIFVKLIDYCIINDLRDGNGNYLINPNIRNNFYKFCYDN